MSTPDAAASLLDAEIARREQPPPSFYEFLTSPEFCRVTPSDMVAAVVAAADGLRPTTIDDETCLRHFGCTLDELPTERRRTVALQAGGRGGKTSRLLAPKALHAAWTVPLPTLADGEHGVSLIISNKLVFARQALRFCIGYLRGSPRLKASVVGTIGTEGFTIRRPDGRLVDVLVRAAAAKGDSGRAFTLVGAHFDEAAFFRDESGAASDKEIYRACSTRIVPGGQLWMCSTPWITGVGVLEEELAANWGHHTETLCVRRVGTKVLNPTWDPTGEIEAKERRTDPDNAMREIDAIPLAEGSKAFFSPEAIEAAFRAGADLPVREPPRLGQLYGAGGDAGFTRNSSALAMVRRIPGTPATTTVLAGPDRYVLSLLEERKPLPGLPLLPEAVAAEFGDLMIGYATRDLAADSHQRDKMAAALVAKKIRVVNAPDKEESHVAARTILHENRLALPPNARLRQQLRDVVAKPMPGGGVQITSPQRVDGSHGDLVSALVSALWQASKGALGPLPHGGRAFSVPAVLPGVWGGTSTSLENLPERSRPAPSKTPATGDRPQPRGQPGKPRGPW